MGEIKVLSLFSGCGGLDLGLEGGFTDVATKKIVPKTRFRTVFANDISLNAKICWDNYFNRPDAFKLESVVDLVKKSEKGTFTFPEADVITGGFPCQDFSVAGKRKGFNSTVSHNGERFGSNLTDCEISIENRGQLYIWMMKVIEKVKPKMFIAENVKGLTNLHDVYNIIREDFSSIGYDVRTSVLNARDFNVAQNRERVFFMGFLNNAVRDEIKNPFPKSGYRGGKKVLVKDVLYDLPEPEFSEDLSHRAYSRAKYYGKGLQGQTEIKWDDVAPTIRSEHHGNIEFRRLSKEHGGKNSDGSERRLSVRECARLQSFPDNYSFVQKGVSASDAYRLIGNAVPPIFAYSFGKHISRHWDFWFE